MKQIILYQECNIQTSACTARNTRTFIDLWSFWAK